MLNWNRQADESMDEMTEPFEPISIVVKDGLILNISSELDVTYQTLEFYDPDELVLAGWSDQTLRYFVTFFKMPDGWTDGEVWLKGFKRDIRFASKFFSFKVLDEQKFRAEQTDVQIHILDHRTFLRGSEGERRSVVAFITDGYAAYTLTCTPLTDNDEDFGMIKSEFMGVLRGCHIDSRVKAINRPLQHFAVGIWQGEYINRDGNSVDSLLQIDGDTTFKFRDRDLVTHKTLPYSGYWFEADGMLKCSFLYTKPTGGCFRSYAEESFNILSDGEIFLEKDDGTDGTLYKRLVE